MAADPGPLRWAWSKTAAPADNLDLIKYDDAGAVGTTAITVVRADSAATFAGSVTAPAVNVGANPVIADPAVGNALVFGATGLFVPASATFVPTAIPATPTITSVESPVGTFTLGVALSPVATTPGNILTAAADGLAAVIPANYVDDTELATALAAYLPLTGGALTGPLSISGLPVIVDPAAGNALVWTATGMMVTVAGLTISPDPGNLIEQRANGLYVRAVGLVFGMP